ncbi:MAG: HEAT repeat domain-containing protein [Acidobacteria bacterium]|nr:HEAT repeat domain-containing protein [Acidobacteriota bacterium]MBI3487149.1 HEAT repeat domain-containing protein [Acidobacteriota bacterium]
MTKVVEQARRLRAEGKTATAETLLLEAGWGLPNREAARQAYDEMFPPNAILKQWLDGALADAQSQDRDVKRKALAAVVHEALSEATPSSGVWLRSPRTTGILIALLRDPDPVAADGACLTLCRVFSLYFRDQRAYKDLVTLLGSVRWLTRMWAVRAVCALRRPDSFQHIETLLADPEPMVRSQTFDWLDRSAQMDVLSEKELLRLERAARAALQDGNATVRARATTVLARIGDRTTLEQLSGRYDPSRLVQNTIAWAIKEISARSGD